MKYSVSWLNELAGTHLSAEEMAELFTRHSFEVEGIEGGVKIPEGVVAGEILEVLPHPDADKLRLARVTVDPEQKEILEIVCGAPNIAEGDIVPVATVGTKLPNGLNIKKSKIRGVESSGMLCAQDELGLGGDHSGILHLPKDAKIGSLVSDIFPSDEVIELDILASRGHDALSHMGVARELKVIMGGVSSEKDSFSLSLRGSAKQSREKKEIASSLRGLAPRNDEGVENQRLSVSIQNPDLCHRYMGVTLENVDNTRETPEWMKTRLEACGINSINLVTDVTNYVMLELGQPMHAFDFGKIKSESPISPPSSHQNGTTDGHGNTQFPTLSLEVRKAKEGEELALLDGQEIALDQDDIVIANETQALALAGVMGGSCSATSEDTTRILLEAAWFDPVSIRKTRMRHKIITESSHRFERNPDENGVETAMARVVELLKDFSGGEVVSVVDEYPIKNEKRDILFTPEACERLLGAMVDRDHMKQIFASLGCEVEDGGAQWTVTAPTFRKDLAMQEDLIEEIGRMVGYDHVEANPLVSAIQVAKIPERYELERSACEVLRAVGFDEVRTYSFYGEKTIELFSLDTDAHFSLANPLNPDQKFFRTRVLPNTLKAAAANTKTVENVRVYELGNVYERGENGDVIESRRLALVQASRSQKDVLLAVREMKGVVESIVEDVTGEKAESADLDDVENTEMFHPTQSMDMAVGGVLVAFVGSVHPFIARRLKLPPSTVMASLDIDALLRLKKEGLQYTPLERFPRVNRDISFLIPDGVTAQAMEECMRNAGGENLLGCELFDVFEKDGQRSLAYRLSFGRPDRTLSGEEGETALRGVVEALKELGVEMKH